MSSHIFIYVKYIFIILFLLFSSICKSQNYENCPDSIPVKEKILRNIFNYKDGEKVKINFNQYLRFDGVIVYNKEIKKDFKVILIKNKDNYLIVYYNRTYFSLKNPNFWAKILNNKNVIIFILGTKYNNSNYYFKKYNN